MLAWQARPAILYVSHVYASVITEQGSLMKSGFLRNSWKSVNIIKSILSLWPTWLLKNVCKIVKVSLECFHFKLQNVLLSKDNYHSDVSLQGFGGGLRWGGEWGICKNA